MSEYTNLTKIKLVEIALERKLIPSKNAARPIPREEMIRILMNADAEAEAAQDATENPLMPVAVSTTLGDVVTTVDAGKADETVTMTAKMEDGVLQVIDSSKLNSLPILSARPPAPKRFPHGAKSAAEVAKINKFKKKRNQKKHKMKLARQRHSWANGQNQLAIQGFKYRRIIAHPDDLKAQARV